MNREFKFRIAYTSQDRSKSLIYSDDQNYLIGLDGTVYENYGKSWKEPFWESVFDTFDLPIVQQFTGFKDINNREIYEGDILKISELDTRYPSIGPKILQTFEKVTVVWKNGAYYYSIIRNGRPPIIHQLLFHGYKPEVIGNIFENPELLK